jgi:4-hydroxy-tetrahydrodipicolinate synthase
MIDEFEAGQTGRARELHLSLLPVYTGLFRNQGLVMTKAALGLLGLPGGPVRPPLESATAAEIRRLREDLELGGLKLPGSGS